MDNTSPSAHLDHDSSHKASLHKHSPYSIHLVTLLCNHPPQIKQEFSSKECFVRVMEKVPFDQR